MYAYEYLEYTTIDDVINDFNNLTNRLKVGDVFQVISSAKGGHHSIIVQSIETASNDILYAQHEGDEKNVSLKATMNRWKSSPDLADNKVDFIIISK